MLSIYRRHREGCAHTADRISRKCRCPLWATGTLEGQPYRKALKTRAFERATQLIREIEAGAQPDPPKKITLKEASQRFIADCEARALSRPSLRKYKLLAARLNEYAGLHGIRDLEEFTSEHMFAFRETWKGSPRTLAKNIERVRAIFNAFVHRGYIPLNPAKAVRLPVTWEKAVEPFSEIEQRKILQAAYELARSQTRTMPKSSPVHPSTGTFAKLLLYTGLRITDAANLDKDRIQSERIFLYQTKTKKPVSIPIAPDLLRELNEIPTHQLFQSPEGSQRPETVSDFWRDQLIKVFDFIGIKHAHPHRFRHSLAVNMLNAGSSIEDVAAVLGNSPAVVQKHYSAWVQSRNDRIDGEIKKLWTKPALLRVK
ncbi:MAG TPA: tyrosine-type recombinase/integrase [Nitrospiraceae bacterium]|nr:tyrosine-type recombinase/integrase [Nitrospiraceae bacterium]